MLKTDNLLSTYPFIGYYIIRINIQIPIWRLNAFTEGA